MRELQRPIEHVWRRLRFQRFLTALVWSFGATLLIVAIALAAQKLTALTLPGAPWHLFAGALGAAIPLAMGVALTGGATRFDAAIAIDRAFHLDERLSTALTLPESLRESAAGQALIADAVRRVAAIDVGTKFGPSLPRLAWIPLVPALLAGALLLAPSMPASRVLARPSPPLDREVVAAQSRALGKKIAGQRKELDKEQHKEAEKLLAEIEKAADQLAKAPPAEKDKALVDLNKLTDAVKERRQKLGSPEQVDRQLQQLKDMARNGPADEFGKALSKGDFQKAANELKSLQQKLETGKLTEQEKKKLQEQLGDMAQQLQKLANLDERRKVLDEARKNGGLNEQQYQQELAKLNQQTQALRSLQALGQKMEAAQQALKQGDARQAAKELGMSEQQLSAMAGQLKELDALDGAMADIQDAKNGMTGDSMNQLGESLGNMTGMGSNRPGQGNGLGRGRGQGDRPEAPDATALYNTKVRQQLKKGKAVLEGFSSSNTPLKGQTVLDVQAEVEASEGFSADALSNQKVPKNVERHVRGYFDQISKSR